MYINMNGGMKDNKVAFCMEDGRVGAAGVCVHVCVCVCARAMGMDGMRLRWQSSTSERGPRILWRPVTRRHQEATLDAGLRFTLTTSDRRAENPNAA